MVKRPYFNVAYGYAVELLFSGLVLFLIRGWGWLPEVRNFLKESSGAWSAFFGLLFAAAIAAWLIWFQMNSEKFGAWLEWKKVSGILSGGFLFNVLLFALVTATTLIGSYVKTDTFANFSVFAVILGLTNATTLTGLIFKLNRLQAKFRLEITKHGL